MTISISNAVDFRKIKEHRLVLTSIGIPSQTIQKNGGWHLLVRPDDRDVALRELQDYQAENVGREVVNPVALNAPGAVWGSLLYCFVIGTISTMAASWGYGYRLADVGTSVAGEVAAGQWYQCVTALTLHLDVGHLASNLLFGSFFGFLVARSYGGGLAWLWIVAAGFFGNLANAYFHAATHQSIGASTAVFGALGIMVTDAFVGWNGQERFRKWTPIVGGIMLLSFLGVGGERTDVMAHVFGFIAGTMLGVVAVKIPATLRERLLVQWVAGAAAFAIVFGCWVLAIA
ncbi:rhomboid family intramembrane serine protease [Roseiconus lacunae]|uniref:Rhomboid family intramembrane serine protease n=1 Tax=Roseiconus lacunae TaxID=2605694 RepID=A0ABT7PME8_9BACT|nr:rhomboid family intramembrane serine protease [Roseiconus lacunae]MCD0461583.1 rhomboid family intramembrane serine protease [Roseiconus lacunae]MDM4017661.1 rhomboid family intramembrane serine protease [Roseiconus lacunae]WRQ51077.1 rhomboid family intramembrane serine protease [Stieleria sp. HD01]